MDDPDFYKRTSDLRCDNHAQFIDEYTSNFNWRVDGKDSVMDIGCAGGNVTTGLILPKLPSTFSRLMGVDINEKMIDYATKNCNIPKVSFRKLDIGGDISHFMRTNEPFDHIISIYCLHLVPDQRLAIQNIYSLLETHGDCFLHILADYSGFDVYKQMYAKWSEYMIDIDDFVSPYHRKINPGDIIKKQLKLAGFKEYTVTEGHKTVAYHDVRMFVDAFQPVIPCFNRIPVKRQAEFLDEYVQLSMEFKPDPGVKAENFRDSQDVNIFISYKFYLVYATK